MAEFRKLFYALGVAALLAGVSTTAKASVIASSQFSTSVSMVGFAESSTSTNTFSDISLDFVGETPITFETFTPWIYISDVQFSTNIAYETLDSGTIATANLAGVLLIIDEPDWFEDAQAFLDRANIFPFNSGPIEPPSATVERKIMRYRDTWAPKSYSKSIPSVEVLLSTARIMNVDMVRRAAPPVYHVFRV